MSLISFTNVQLRKTDFSLFVFVFKDILVFSLKIILFYIHTYTYISRINGKNYALLFGSTKILYFFSNKGKITEKYYCTLLN